MRRAEHDRKELFDRGLAAAREIVCEEGHKALTARRIAAALNCSVGTVYNVFQNLDDVIIHINAQTMDEMYAELSQIDLSGAPEEALERLAKGYMSFNEANPNLRQLMFEHEPTDKDQVPSWFFAKIERSIALIEVCLESYFDGSDQGKQQCRRAARALWAGFYGITTMHYQNRLALFSDEGVEGMIDDFAEIFIAGLSARSVRNAAE